jgi:spore maturation protein CgeB
MKMVIFGLSVSSSWGNGHATLWRGLGRALARRGHGIIFFERDLPFYAAHRDAIDLDGIDLRIYPEWQAARAAAADELRDSDVAMVTSFCPDAQAAEREVLGSSTRVRCFYDLDTPVTLAAIRAGVPVPYVGSRGLRDYDLVLSYTGGRALDELRARLGAAAVAPLYGSVDPLIHRPVQRESRATPHRYALSYLGTYAADRQATLERLFVEPARAKRERAFLIGGAQYPESIRWPANVTHLTHVAPAEHAAFYAAAPLTLNVTRADMAEMGYCPSARLFEAAACGVPVVSDPWEGLDTFFHPGDEILLAATTAAATDAIDRPPDELQALGRRARERALEEHTADHRAAELERILERVASRAQAMGGAHAGGAAIDENGTASEGEPPCSV